MVDQTPLIIAHRGASADMIENTLAAFALAADQGADGIELDVQFSSDGRIVICHDNSLERLTGNKDNVCDLTLAGLQDIDLGDNECIPTLDELFELLGPRMLYNIELKDYGLRSSGLETAVADRVESFGLESHVLISSFSPFSVRRARRAFSRSVPVALIRYKGLYKYGYWLARGEADHPHYKLVDESYMAWCTKHGYRTHVWTVNDAGEAQRLAQLGVHGIITDKPQFIRHNLS